MTAGQLDSEHAYNGKLVSARHLGATSKAKLDLTHLLLIAAVGISSILVQQKRGTR